VYDRTTTGHIIYQPVSAATGYSSKLLKLGEVNNKGTELMLSLNEPVKLDGLSWTTLLTCTKNVGEVVRLGESTTDDI